MHQPEHVAFDLIRYILLYRIWCRGCTGMLHVG